MSYYVDSNDLFRRIHQKCGEQKTFYLNTLHIFKAINECEKIDAIPVKFVEDQMAFYKNEKDFEHCDALFDFIEAWRAEKE